MVQSKLPKIDLTLREQRGKEIANNKGSVKQVNDNSFKVKSQIVQAKILPSPSLGVAEKSNSILIPFSNFFVNPS